MSAEAAYGRGERSYRRSMGGSRFVSCTLSVAQSDIWIGIDPKTAQRFDIDTLLELARRELIRCRSRLAAYEETHPGFFSSFIPLPEDPGAFPAVQKMLSAGLRAGTGPMAAVAGAIAEAVGNRIAAVCEPDELVVENGGDIYLRLREDLRLRVYAGGSPLSEKIGLVIPASATPLGVCTSAGTVGPSCSRGTADAVTVCCTDTAAADAYATAFGNQVSEKADVDRVMELIRSREDILSALVIKDDRAGVYGEFEVFTE